MDGERLMEASLYAIWAAGSALAAIPGLSRLLAVWDERRRRASLLEAVRERRRLNVRELVFVRKLADDMEIAEIRLPVELVVGSMLFFAVFGWFAADGAIEWMRQHFAMDADRMSDTRTESLQSAAAVLLGSIPYFYVKFRLQRKRHRIALDMIKLVQNLIGHYGANRTVQELISRASSSMPDHVRSEWIRLELGSHMGGSLEEALFEFARRVDNDWAEDVADILMIKHKYGNDVLDALHKLVVDMQTARKNEEKRLAMVTVYRIGTGVMVAFAFAIVLFNVYADGANYRHYFVNPTGRWIMLVSAAVLFGSMIMVVRSGRRTF